MEPPNKGGEEASENWTSAQSRRHFFARKVHTREAADERTGRLERNKAPNRARLAPPRSVDEAELKDIVVFEPSIYDKAGGWSAATTELLADGARLRAWRDHALAAYRRRFDPVALLRQADAWNERARGDL